MKKFAPLVLFFLATTMGTILLKTWLHTKGVDTNVVLMGNAILFITSFLATVLYTKASANKKTIGFLKQFYSGFMLKFFVLIGALAIYLFNVESPNQPGLYLCMAFYLVYHFLGTIQASKKSDAQAG